MLGLYMTRPLVSPECRLGFCQSVEKRESLQSMTVGKQNKTHLGVFFSFLFTRDQ